MAPIQQSPPAFHNSTSTPDTNTRQPLQNTFEVPLQYLQFISRLGPYKPPLQHFQHFRKHCRSTHLDCAQGGKGSDESHHPTLGGILVQHYSVAVPPDRPCTCRLDPGNRPLEVPHACARMCAHHWRMCGHHCWGTGDCLQTQRRTRCKVLYCPASCFRQAITAKSIRD